MEPEALESIEHAQRYGYTALDLSHHALTVLLSDIGRFTNPARIGLKACGPGKN